MKNLVQLVLDLMPLSVNGQKIEPWTADLSASPAESFLFLKSQHRVRRSATMTICANHATHNGKKVGGFFFGVRFLEPTAEDVCVANNGGMSF